MRHTEATDFSYLVRAHALRPHTNEECALDWPNPFAPPAAATSLQGLYKP